MKKIISLKFRILLLFVAAITVLNIQIFYGQQEHPARVGQPSAEKNLYVYFLDVGQGDSAFIRTPNGKNILIDAGQCAIVNVDEFDAGKEIVIPFLIKKNITKIDYVVASHAHADHLGGLLSVMKKFPVGVVYDSGFSYSSPIYENFLQIIKLKKISYNLVGKGDVLNWDPDLTVKVLSPRKNNLFEDPNNNSIVLKITYKNVSFLFTGDAEALAEDEIVGNYKKSELSSVILKVPHHGSKTSSTEYFLDAVNPEVAVISCGRYNRFRHPHPDTVRRFDDFNIELHRTDKEGTIFVSTDGETYTIKSLGFKK
ncbi:MAG: ComEC/Rec2 family competence protein [Elusimicrobiota bacterium]|nr:ComEC/Rec2 family competence protein [Elusimicrobiota bacterium]